MAPMRLRVDPAAWLRTEFPELGSWEEFATPLESSSLLVVAVRATADALQHFEGNERA